MQLKLSEKMQIMSDRAKDADIRSTIQERELKQSLGRVDNKIMKIEENQRMQDETFGMQSNRLESIEKILTKIESHIVSIGNSVSEENAPTNMDKIDAATNPA